jgi:UDP-N-acetylglucosamine 2-epimerase (non-hydrolysing)
VIFPMHPRTRQCVADFGLDINRLRITEPLPYVEFFALQMHAAVVITDSGGIQEETTYFRVPCLTMRSNTERPIRVTLSTNVLTGSDTAKLWSELMKVLDGKSKPGDSPPLWDGTPPKGSPASW